MGTSVNNRLRLLRKTLGLTQEQFGNKIGRKASYISNVERGITTPSIAFLFRVSHEYDVEVGWLKTGQGNMMKSSE